MNKEFNMIKKYYGEKMLHLCRELFPTILEKEGKLISLLESKFVHNKYLYDDLITYELVAEFKNFIYNLGIEENEYTINTNKTPFELLSYAGYNLYECHTEEDIQRFKSFYREGEELCTFKGNRLDKCYVFFAVKKDVNKIKREDFLEPKRQDLYGTSVISIQFTIGSVNTLSIKNRYNHTVSNPDATFSNNLENIIPGLTKSFEKKYHLNINYNKEKFSITDAKYIMANNGKFYPYNYEINGICYCPDNVIINHGKVIDKYCDKSKYLLIDYFIIDLQNKDILFYDVNLYQEDSFLDSMIDILKIEVTKDKKEKIIKIYLPDNNIILKINNRNCLTSYINNKIKKINSAFLKYNETLNYLEMNNLEEAGNDFLGDNYYLKTIDLPNLVKVGNNFIHRNQNICSVNLPLLEEAGNSFLSSNMDLEKLELLNLKKAGSFFLALNEMLKEINLPKLESSGTSFLTNNLALTKISFPSLEVAKDMFIVNNKIIEEVNLPKLKIIENHFLMHNRKLIEISLPELISVENNFMLHNYGLQKAYFPKLKTIYNSFLYNNSEIESLFLPNLEQIGACFMTRNGKIKELIVPSLQIVGIQFLSAAVNLEYIDISNLSVASYNFLGSCKKLKTIILGTTNNLYDELDDNKKKLVSKK